jgi:hypothetical protein
MLIFILIERTRDELTFLFVKKQTVNKNYVVFIHIYLMNGNSRSHIENMMNDSLKKILTSNIRD